MAGLLFTDLEGSTAHVRALGDAYGAVLARHHEIIRTAVAAEGGHEVGSEGDSIAAVLPTPAAAVRAAVAAQRALAAEPWPGSPWRVRMAVHAGTVDTTSAGVVGIALHEAARLRNIAHGGQVIVSNAAVVAGVDASLEDLGVHAVRDFAAPVRVHQVRAPGLVTAFPPLRTGSGRSIPESPTPFVGRARELDELAALVATNRLTTIVGAGGCGKTRLAYEAASRSPALWVVVVELAPLSDPTQVSATVAAAVGAVDAERITESIRDCDVLLVVDNCEHVIDAVGELLADVIATCPRTNVLATSRSPLEIASERVWRVPTMDPDDAAELFVQRASESSVAAADRGQARSLCQRLDGMPLAIELAAARLRSLTMEDLTARLDDRLGVLVGGARDVPRQRTLRATLDWSHDLLRSEEQAALRRASVFQGGFTLDGAEAILRQPTPIQTLAALDGLVQQSLLQLDRETGRFHFLEPVRQYAFDHLTDAGEAEAAVAAHVTWVEHLAAEGAIGIFVDQGGWTRKLDVEMPNVGAALGRLVDLDDLDRAALLLTALSFYWSTANRGDAVVWIERLLPCTDALSPRARARFLLTAGMVYNDDLEDPRPTAWLLEAVGLFRDVGSRRGLCASLFWLGRARFHREYSTDLGDVFEEAGAIATECGDRITQGWCRLWLGILTRVEGDLDTAEAIDMALLDWAVAHDVGHVMAAARAELCSVAVLREDWSTALAQSDASIESFRAVGDRWQLAINLCQRSLLDVAIGDLAAAKEHALEALHLTSLTRGSKDFGYSLIAAAFVLHAAGREDDATALVSIADRVAGINELALRILRHDAPGAADRLLTMIQTPPARSRDDLSALEAMELAREWLVVI